MIRKFNYTNRKKIKREDVLISTSAVNGRLYFNAVIKKEALAFPEHSKVFIEPYYGPSYLRFNYGTAGNIQEPSDTDITELRSISEKVYFRIKIVDETNDRGLLVGFADRLPLSDDSEPANRASILYVNPVEMDTHEIWRLNFDADSEGMPILEVNMAIEGIKELARSDHRFISFVFPAAVRLVLKRIYTEKEDGTDGWSFKWIEFTRLVLGISDRPSIDAPIEEVDEWIDDCVKSFCIKHKTLDNYIKTIA